jgi:PAS domain S-box-containing protein
MIEVEAAMIDPDHPFESFSFQLLADYLPQFIWICTADGRCDYSNRRWLDYAGVAAPTNGAANWRDWIHPDDQPRLTEAWTRATASGEVLRIELRLRRHDAAYRWFDTQALPLRDAVSEAVKWIISGTDIQDTVDTRLALQASEQRARKMFDSAPVSLWVEDMAVLYRELAELKRRGIGAAEAYIRGNPQFVERMVSSINVLDVNQEALRLFRATHKQQLLGHSLGKIYTTAAAKADFANTLILMLRSKDHATVEMEHVALDGSILQLRCHGQQWSHNTDYGLVLSSRIDITESNRLITQLHYNSQMLEHMSRLAKVGGWAVDVGSGDSHCTDEVTRIYGFASGKPFKWDEGVGCLDDANRQLAYASLQGAIEQAQAFDMQYQLIRGPASGKWLRSQGLPVVHNGRVIRVEGATQDITDRKLAELAVQSLNENLEQQVAERTQQLEQARHDLQTILDAIPCMVGYWDKNLRLRFSNLSYQKVVGKQADELQGRHFSELLTGNILHYRLPLAQRALQGEAQRFEAWLVSPANQQTFRANTYYQPDIVGTEVRGFYVLVIDITDQRQAEDGLRAANRELEAFAYAVAHDLRAPLRAMSGFSHALLEDYGPALPAEAQGFAEEINKAGQRMGELLDGLLTLSRSTQGELRRDRVDLSALALTLLAELQRMEPQRRVQWQVTPELIAFGDSRMLEVVLRNLLDNAWKYTAHAALAQIRVDANYLGGICHYRVTDNGAGFDMAHVERLFKPFQRLHRQDEFPGLGIGLATVRRIVNRHGGELIAQGIPGQGAEFRFSLGEQLQDHQP